MHKVAFVMPCFLQSDNMEEVERKHAEDNITDPVLKVVQESKTPETYVAKFWSRESCVLLQQWNMITCDPRVHRRGFSHEKKK